MVSVLIDIHLLEAKMDIMRIIPKDSAQYVYDKLETELFALKKIGKTDYLNSYEYYMSQPDELAKIYGTIVDSLMKTQNRGSYESLSEQD